MHSFFFLYYPSILVGDRTSSRKRRFTREQARDALVQAGLELLAEEGPTTGLGAISLAAAISRSGVPTPSAYRLYASDDSGPQSHYERDLISAMLESVDAGESAVEATLVELLGPAVDLSDSADAATLAHQLRQLLRDAGDRLVPAALSAPNTAVQMSVMAAAQAGHLDDEVVDALRRSEFDSGQLLQVRYRELGAVFGMRLRTGWTWDHLGATLATALRGASLCNGLVPGGDSDIERPTGADGQIEGWSLLAVQLEGIVMAAFERDPRVVNGVDPQSWFDTTG